MLAYLVAEAGAILVVGSLAVRSSAAEWRSIASPCCATLSITMLGLISSLSHVQNRGAPVVLGGAALLLGMQAALVLVLLGRRAA